MKTTLDLLNSALATGRTIPEWTRLLGLSRNALYTSQLRGHLSPAIAGAMADELGLDFKEWLAIAALESDKDSACKTRMLTRFAKESRVSKNV